jgi:hypothetical protein
MDHLNSMLESNLDDLVARQVSPNRCILTTLSDHVGLIGFCRNITSSANDLGGVKIVEGVLTLPVHAKSVLITAIPLAPPQWMVSLQPLPENRDRLQRELVGLIASQNLHKCSAEASERA